jgi:hypothetical protein
LTAIDVLRRWARLLDTQFRVPGTGVRFGLDPILSVIPGIGDLASPLFAVAVLLQAARVRVPKIVMVRMLINAGIDALIGLVPVAGTVGDVFWRANAWNLALLERHARPGRPPSTGDYLFVGGVIVAIILIGIASIAAGFLLVLLLWHLLSSRPLV